MASLVDVLAMLVRKNLGDVPLRASSGAVLTVRELYEHEERMVAAGAPAPGDYRSRMEEGLLIVETGTGDAAVRTFVEVM